MDPNVSALAVKAFQERCTVMKRGITFAELSDQLQTKLGLPKGEAAQLAWDLVQGAESKQEGKTKYYSPTNQQVL